MSRNKGHTLDFSFLAFRWFIPQRHFLNSTPQLFARDRRAIVQGAELGPGDLRMDAAAEAAVGTGDDVFSADERAAGDTSKSQRGEKVARTFYVCVVIGFN